MFVLEQWLHVKELEEALQLQILGFQLPEDQDHTDKEHYNGKTVDNDSRSGTGNGPGGEGLGHLLDHHIHRIVKLPELGRSQVTVNYLHEVRVETTVVCVQDLRHESAVGARFLRKEVVQIWHVYNGLVQSL